MIFIPNILLGRRSSWIVQFVSSLLSYISCLPFTLLLQRRFFNEGQNPKGTLTCTLANILQQTHEKVVSWGKEGLVTTAPCRKNSHFWLIRKYLLWLSMSVIIFCPEQDWKKWTTIIKLFTEYSSCRVRNILHRLNWIELSNTGSYF